MEQPRTSRERFLITGKDILFFLLLWVILFIEPVSIGPVKISQIWKGIIVFLLLFSIIKRKLPIYIWMGFLFAFKFLIYTEMPYGMLRAVQDFLEAIILPLTLAYLIIRYKNGSLNQKHFIRIPIWLSLFVIYSSVPFLFGLKSLNPDTDLEKYGLEANAMKGLFYHIATSSKLYTVATVILFITYKYFSHNFFYKAIWLLAVLLGAYFVYTSWTRTGWLIFSIAMIISVFYRSNIKRKTLGIAFSLIVMAGLGWLYETNEAFRLRLSGGAVYRTNTELSVAELAKARLPFISTAIENLSEEGFGAQVIGYGTQHGIDLFEDKTGMAIVSHNRTFEILESSGIFGLVVYLIFLYTIFRETKKNRSQELTPPILDKLFVVSTVMFLGFYITSHGTPLWGEIIFGCIIMGVICLNKNERTFSNETKDLIY
jgi:hypothetical protein